MPKNSLTHSFVSDPDEVAVFFQALIDGFKNRRISITSDGNEQTIVPADILDINVESTHRKGRVRLNLQVSWTDPAPHPRRDLFTNTQTPAVDKKMLEGEN